jgi:effector-binding domain-containing protein
MSPVALAPVPVDVPAVTAVQLTCHAGPEPDALRTAMEDAFEKIGVFLGKHRLVPTGPPRAIYTTWGPEGTTFTLAFPIRQPGPGVTTGEEDIAIRPIAAGKAWRFSHHGAYSSMMATYGQIGEWLKSQGLWHTEADWARFMPMWEEYLTEPDKTPEAEQLTYIYVPRE